MAQFTPAQIAEIETTVIGQCEAFERTNAWAYNFSPEADRRGRAVHHLMQRAASSIGCLLTDLTPADVQELTFLVLRIVQAYDRRNHIAPAF